MDRGRDVSRLNRSGVDPAAAEYCRGQLRLRAEPTRRADLTATSYCEVRDVGSLNFDPKTIKSRAPIVAGVDPKLAIGLYPDVRELAAAVDDRHALRGSGDDGHHAATAKLDGAELRNGNLLQAHCWSRDGQRKEEQRQCRTHGS